MAHRLLGQLGHLSATSSSSSVDYPHQTVLPHFALEQLQIVKPPPLVLSLEDGAFQGCCALREVVAPGCVQLSRRAFAECCSLSSIGVSQTTDGDNVLAPGAQLGRYASESCLTLSSITFVMDQTNKARALPEGAFCGSGLEALCLPTTFTILARGRVKIASDWWKSTLCVRKSQSAHQRHCLWSIPPHADHFLGRKSSL